MARVTLKDVANACGMSQATVSLALNDRPCRLSKETRERVKRTAEELGYVPNPIARSLATQESGMYGLIVPNIESRYHASLARRLEETCRADGKVLLIANSGGTHEARLVKMLASRGVDGIFLVMKDDRTPDPELTSELVDADVPYVMLDRFYDNFECDIVSFDNELGGYLATKHLLDRGHRSIACIINSRDTKNGRDRYRGYMRAMLETNHTLPANCILEGEDTVEHGYSSMKGLLSSGITAVFAGSDEISLGVLKCLHEQNLRVPLDYSVVAYGGGYSDSLFEPPLTVASRDVDGMVHIAYALLEKRRADAKAPCAHEILRPRLVVGGSACPVHERNAFRS